MLFRPRESVPGILAAVLQVISAASDCCCLVAVPLEGVVLLAPGHHHIPFKKILTRRSQGWVLLKRLLIVLWKGV